MNERKYTYALLSPLAKVVKIGCTDNILRRVADIQRMSPVPLVLIGKCDRNIEKEIHSKLKDQWAYGEWFTYNDHAIDVIAARMEPCAVDVVHTVRASTYFSTTSASDDADLHRVVAERAAKMRAAANRDRSMGIADAPRVGRPGARTFFWRGKERPL